LSFGTDKRGINQLSFPRFSQKILLCPLQILKVSALSSWESTGKILDPITSTHPSGYWTTKTFFQVPEPLDVLFPMVAELTGFLFLLAQITIRRKWMFGAWYG
jgi:hypothetical protein